jgi:hypothetical protein
VRVVPGQVLVSSVVCPIATGDVVVFDIDCRSNYPDFDLAGGADTVEVVLSGWSRTRHVVDRAEAATRVVLPRPPGGEWLTWLRGGRYSVQVAFTRWDRDGCRVVWDARTAGDGSSDGG